MMNKTFAEAITRSRGKRYVVFDSCAYNIAMHLYLPEELYIYIIIRIASFNLLRSIFLIVLARNNTDINDYKNDRKKTNTTETKTFRSFKRHQIVIRSNEEHILNSNSMTIS